jgi:(p)ppGpp synthase/HD superfamily hydrolase
VVVAPTDRGNRETTQKITQEVKAKTGGAKKKVKAGRKRVETKKSKRARELLDKLFEIGLPDVMQPKERLSFLVDQRSERKEKLAPLIGKTGIERRRENRIAEQNERAKREKERAAERFQAVPVPESK